MTPEERARIVAEGAAVASEVMPPLTDAQADTIAQILAYTAAGSARAALSMSSQERVARAVRRQP